MPAGKIYLGGNTLGAASHDSLSRLARAGDAEWAANLVSAWNLDDWIGMPCRVGDKIATLVGAGPGEVAVTDSTTVNLFKLLTSARRMRPDCNVILTDRENFPTDLYIIDEVAARSGCRVVHAPAAEPAHAIERLGDQLAVVIATEVDYISGARGDVGAVNAAALAVGGLTLWDLSHSVGIVPVDLTAAATDFAASCTYKYLNSGRGAPAFLYVAKRHQQDAAATAGWVTRGPSTSRPITRRPSESPATRSAPRRSSA